MHGWSTESKVHNWDFCTDCSKQVIVAGSRDSIYNWMDELQRKEDGDAVAATSAATLQGNGQGV